VPTRQGQEDTFFKIPKTAEEVAALEAAYRPFEPAAAWSDVPCDTARWKRHAEALTEAVQRADDGVWADLRERFLRAAALDSSALAELIRPAPDMTTVVLRNSITTQDWTSIVEANRLVVECHRRALVVAADAAAAGVPIDESLIGRLQDLIVESQQTYTVSIADGSRMEVDLPRRQYKPVSNYLRSPVEGLGLVPFAPANRVAEEMSRLTAELASDAYRNLHPVVQSAFVHFSLQCIHPFADGNGRLCRTMAAIPLLREVGLPQLILADQWPAYLQALGRGHQGDLRPLVELFIAVQIDTMALARDLLGSREPVSTTLSSVPLADSPERLLRDLVLVHLKETLGGKPDVRVTPGLSDYTVHAALPHVEAGWSDVGFEVRTGADGWLRLEATTGALLEIKADEVHPVPLEIVHLRVGSWLDRVLDTGGVTAAPPRGLFVLGVPRSGTTVIGNYIGSHPNVLGLAEYAGFYVAHSIAPAYINPLPGRQHAEFLVALAELASSHASTAAREAGCSWFCDATPWNLEIAGALASSLPDAIFVLMLRHFSGAVLSLRQFGWAGNSWEDAAGRWTGLNSCITQLPVDRTIVLSYDVLAEQPVETLAGLHEALATAGLDPGGFDPVQFTASHAAVVGKPGPTIAQLVDGQVVFRSIPSLDGQRWTPEAHAEVWPVVAEMHRALASSFPNVYVSPPRPDHVPADQW
jgi:sulfotransferase family protein/Fic/DOC family protein